MRNSKLSIIPNKAGEISTILLEGDYCGEHERGIKPLHQLLQFPQLKFGEGGIPQNYTGPWGLTRILAQPIQDGGDHLRVIDKPETKAKLGYYRVTLSASGFYSNEDPKPNIEIRKKAAQEDRTCWDSRNYKESDGTPSPWEGDRRASWGEEGFQIETTNPELQSFLRKIVGSLKGEAKCHPFALWLGGAGNNPFARNGLCIGLADLIDPENKIIMSEAEQDQAKLYWAAHATGIPALIPKTKYFALSPGPTLKSRTSHGEIHTEHPIMFFLNPFDQKNNNFGWFTVEELRDWMEGKGPVIKN